MGNLYTHYTYNSAYNHHERIPDVYVYGILFKVVPMSSKEQKLDYLVFINIYY